MSSDPRSLSLALFHALSSSIRRQDELTARTARALVVEAVSLLPDFTVTQTEKPHVIRIRTQEGIEFDYNIQDAADALVHLHEDYRKTLGEE